MSNPVPEGLPVWVQALIYLGTIAGSVIAAVLGWKRKAPGASEAPNTLIAGDIMDTRPMRDLAGAVDRLADSEDRTAAAMDRVERAIDRQTAMLERTLK